MCKIDDAEPWEFMTSGIRKAAKPHRCGECGRTIPKGEAYEYVCGKADGYFSISRTCQHCQIARKWLIEECGGYLYGGVFEDLAEHANDQIGGFKLGRLVIGMKHHWKRLTSDELMPLPRI